MNLKIGTQRPPLSQMSGPERRDYLAQIDPSSRKQAEEALGIKPRLAQVPPGKGG
jgi:hypothetical protein